MAGVWLSFAADVARNAVRGTPYKVVEVDGWKTRGHGGFRVVEGITGHHTATPDKAMGDYPSLNIVSKGRSDLPGPLCNYGLGRSGTIYVVAAGVAWHAGASAYAGFADLNDEFAGIEAESAGLGGWTAAQRDCYPRLVGAFLSYIRRDAARYCSHRTCALPKGRKPDPAGIEDSWMITAARSFMSGKAPVSITEEDDLDARQAAQLDTLLAQITGNKEPWNFTTPWPTWEGGTGEKLTMVDFMRRTNVEVRQAWLEIKALRAELAAMQARTGGSTGALSDADVARIAAAVNADAAKRMQS